MGEKIPHSVIIVLLLLLCITTCTGCWDRRELKDLALVAGVGFDLPARGEGVTLIAQVIDPEMLRSPQGPSRGGGDSVSSSKPYWNITSTGETIFEAVRNCTHQSPFPLFWAHCQVAIFSEQLARQGVKDYLDFLLRDYETGPYIVLLVAEEKPEDILNLDTRLRKIPAFNLEACMKHLQNATSHGLEVTLGSFTKMLASQSRAPLASLVKAVKGEQGLYFSLEETAVFNRQAQMVGKLNREETRGLLWVLGEIKGGIIVIKSPDGSSKASMEILKSKSKVKPFLENGRIGVNISVQLESALGENWAFADELKESGRVFLEQQQAAVVEKEIRMAIEKARQLDADIFGFGDRFYQTYPQQWQKLKPDWNDIFKSLEVTVEVDSRMLFSPITSRSIRNF